MILECASLLNEQADIFKNKTKELLTSIVILNSLDQDILSTESELVFANGNTIEKLKLKSLRFSGIETALPSLSYIDVIPKTHLGLKGTLMITEQVINGLSFN